MTITAENITTKKLTEIFLYLDTASGEIDDMIENAADGTINPQQATSQLAAIKARIDKAFEA